MMLTSSAPVLVAQSLSQALQLRADHPDAAVLAGGTDLMVAIEMGAIDPPRLLNLWGCEGLRGISVEADAHVRIGALSTWLDVQRDPRVTEVIQDCARTIGARQIQNRATVGGNIVNASPAGDSLPLWLALDAEFEVASVRGHRRVAAADFFRGYRDVELAPDELLVAIHVPPLGTDRVTYRKVGTRQAQAISKVVMAGRLRVVDGVVQVARVAMGSVAPTPVRCHTVEAALVGGAVDPDAADLLDQDISPIDDVRSTAAYRRIVARNILRTWLVGVS